MRIYVKWNNFKLQKRTKNTDQSEFPIKEQNMNFHRILK